MKSFFTNLWKDESGQGTAEYVLILAAIVGVAAMFRTKIKEWFTKAAGSVDSSMEGFNAAGGQ
jgi:Flp pilus assembly pilin Flp